MRLHQLPIRRAVIVGLAACALPAAHGERLLLSEPAPASSFVPQGYLASPDGEWVVYRHDPAVDNAYELYAVRRDASARVRLSYPLPTGTAVDSFAIASDSRRVVFLVAQEIPGVKELWSVAIEGPSESAIKLNPAGYRVRAFELSADGARVAFEVEPTGGGPVEVWSVPIAGPAASAVQLSPPASPPMSGVWQGSIRISPDGSRAVWIGDFATAGIQEVWSAPLAGPNSEALKVSPVSAPQGDVFTAEIDPASQRVVFRGDTSTDGVFELWSVPLLGPAAAAVKLNPAPVVGGDVIDFVLTPVGGQVVFTADILVKELRELWSVPIAGPAAAAVKLHPTPVGNGVFALPSCGQVSPDGARVVFSGDLTAVGEIEVWSAQIGVANSAVALSGSIAAGGDAVTCRMTPDGSRVVFRGDLNIDERYQLYSRPTDGSGTRTTLTNLSVFPDADVLDYQISSNSQFVAYLVDIVVDGQFELRKVPVIGGMNEVLSGSMPAFAQVVEFSFTSDSLGVLFRADMTFANSYELFVADRWIFSADFEEGDTSEWSTSSP